MHILADDVERAVARVRDFDAGCTADQNLSIVLRDLDLVTPTDKGYVFASC